VRLFVVEARILATKCLKEEKVLHEPFHATHMKISPQSDIIKNSTNQVHPNRKKGNNTFKLVLILSILFYFHFYI